MSTVNSEMFASVLFSRNGENLCRQIMLQSRIFNIANIMLSFNVIRENKTLVKFPSLQRFLNIVPFFKDGETLRNMQIAATELSSLLFVNKIQLIIT